MGQTQPKYFLPEAPYGASPAANTLNPTQPGATNPQVPLLPPNFQDPGTTMQGTPGAAQNMQSPAQGRHAPNDPVNYRKLLQGLFAFLLLLFAPSVWATTTVTGKIQNLGATNLTSGTFVRFWLRGCAGNQPRVNGTAIIGPSQGGVFFVDLSADASGNISGTLYSTRDAAGTGNGEIECGGSKTAVWYGMQIFVAGKGGPEIPVHAKNGVTLDITQVTPITTNPVIASPTGDSTYLRLDGGNQPLTGNIGFSAQMNANAGGALIGSFSGNHTLTGNNIHSGTETFNGQVNVTALLNAAAASFSGVVTFTSTITGNLIPTVTDTQTLGGASLGWQYLFIAGIGGATAQISSGNSVNVVLNLPPTTGTAMFLQSPSTVALGVGGTGGLGPAITSNTSSASTNASIGSTILLSPGSVAATVYRFSFYVDQTVVGTSCAGTTTVAVNVIFTDPNAGGTNTFVVGTVNVAVSGNGAVGNPSILASGSWIYPFASKAGQTISYSTTYTAGGSCSPGPSYQVYPRLEVL